MCDTQSSLFPLCPAGQYFIFTIWVVTDFVFIPDFITLFWLPYFLCPPFSSTGFGGCVDLIVDGVSLLNKIALPPSDQPLHHDYIENEVQLAQSFAYFFAPGAAAE